MEEMLIFSFALGTLIVILPIIPAALAPPPYVTLNLVQGLFLRKAQPSNSNSKPLDLLVFRNLRACRAMDPEPSSG